MYQGVPVEGEPAVIAADMPQSAALVRDSVPSGIPLELETAERTKVSVSGGELSAFDAEGMLLGSGKRRFIGIFPSRTILIFYWCLQQRLSGLLIRFP